MAARSRGRQPAASRHGQATSGRHRRRPLQRLVGQGDDNPWFSSNSPSRLHTVRLRSRARARGRSKCPRRTPRMTSNHRRPSSEHQIATSRQRRSSRPTTPLQSRRALSLATLRRNPLSSLAVQRYRRSAAGARGSVATDAPVRLQRPVRQPYVFDFALKLALARRATIVPNRYIKTIDVARNQQRTFATRGNWKAINAPTDAAPTLGRMIPRCLVTATLARCPYRRKYATDKTANVTTEPMMARENATSDGVIAHSPCLPNVLPFSGRAKPGPLQRPVRRPPLLDAIADPRAGYPTEPPPCRRSLLRCEDPMAEEPPRCHRRTSSWPGAPRRSREGAVAERGVLEPPRSRGGSDRRQPRTVPCPPPLSAER